MVSRRREEREDGPNGMPLGRVQQVELAVRNKESKTQDVKNTVAVHKGTFDRSTPWVTRRRFWSVKQGKK